MLGALTVGLAGVALVAFLASQLPRAGLTGELSAACPACGAAMRPLTSGPSTDPAHVRSYDVLACPACPTAATTVHGAASAWAYCPACQQRTLEVATVRLASADEVAEVECVERCHLCSYDDTARITAELPRRPRGVVIPFPRR